MRSVLLGGCLLWHRFRHRSLIPLSIAVLAALASVVPGAANAAESLACDMRMRMSTVETKLQLHVAVRCDPRVKLLFPAYQRSAEFIATPRTVAGTELISDGGRGWQVPPGEQVGYTVELARMAEQLDDYRTAMQDDEAILAPLSSWLLTPATGLRDAIDIRLRVARDPAIQFASALREQHGTLIFGSDDIRRSGYTVFGQFPRAELTLPAPGSLAPRPWGTAAQPTRYEMVLLGAMKADQVLIRDWLQDSANAVARFYGGFPVDRMLVVVLAEPNRKGMVTGRALSAGGATALVIVGAESNIEQLYGDWIMVHELLHLGQPFTPRAWWLMEGMATYFEPIIRARASWRSPLSVWREFRRDMQRGSHRLTGAGLAHSQGNDYWSGGLFMLLADVAIRRYTRGERGMEDCLLRVLRAGGDATQRWTPNDVVSVCDKHLGKPVLRDLFDRYVDNGSLVDLDALWTQLGVHGSGPSMHLSADAPFANIRDMIITGGRNRPMPVGPDTYR
jgi:hypothetical protein